MVYGAKLFLNKPVNISKCKNYTNENDEVYLSDHYALEAMIISGKSNIRWEDVLYSFIEKRIPIHYFDVAGTFWSEVDTLQDYNYLQNWIKNQDMPKPHKIIQSAR